MVVRYRYEAITRTGERVQGFLDAGSASAVADDLDRMGSYAFNIAEAGDAGIQADVTGKVRLSKAQTTLFLREAGMLLAAGIAVDEALALIGAEARSKGLRAVSQKLRHDLAEGKSFHDALRDCGGVFDTFVTSMVGVGEASGTLAVVLENVAESRERQQKIRDQLVSAMLYPGFLIVTAIVAVGIMLGFVVPAFKAMIVNSQASIPPETQFIISLSDWVNAHGSTVAVIIVLGAAAGLLALRSRRARRWASGMLFSLPVAGHLLRLNLTIRFCRALATLTGCGVELPRALRLIQEMFDGGGFGRYLNEAYEALRNGQDFCEPLVRSRLLQPVAVNMLRVGQETGDLAGAAGRVAGMFESKFDVAVRRVFIVLEPAVILLVSLFVALVIISLIGAVISVNDLVI